MERQERKVTRKKEKYGKFVYYIRQYIIMVGICQLLLFSLKIGQILPLKGCLLYSPLWLACLIPILFTITLNGIIKINLWNLTRIKKQIDEGLKD